MKSSSQLYTFTYLKPCLWADTFLLYFLVYDIAIKILYVFILKCEMSCILYVTCFIINDVKSHLMISVCNICDFLLWNACHKLWWQNIKLVCTLDGNAHIYIVHACQMSVASCVMCRSHCMWMRDHYDNEGRHLDINKSVCVIFITFMLY